MLKIRMKDLVPGFSFWVPLLKASSRKISRDILSTLPLGFIMNFTKKGKHFFKIIEAIQR